jgi:hypothetical protein
VKVTVEDGYIVIRLRLGQPHPSNSGKSTVVASTRGPKRSDVKIKGKYLHVIANAFFYPTEAED